jgi:hypothetical protein
MKRFRRVLVTLSLLIGLSGIAAAQHRGHGLHQGRGFQQDRYTPRNGYIHRGLGFQRGPGARTGNIRHVGFVPTPIPGVVMEIGIGPNGPMCRLGGLYRRR